MFLTAGPCFNLLSLLDVLKNASANSAKNKMLHPHIFQGYRNARLRAWETKNASVIVAEKCPITIAAI